MKRIQLFEWEDQPWFPDLLRRQLTAMITVVHRLLGTSSRVAPLLADLLKQTGRDTVVDFCSGDGGPMPDVLCELRQREGLENTKLVLTDLFPNPVTKARLAAKETAEAAAIQYHDQPVDATQPDNVQLGVRTLIAGFHHFSPEAAARILQHAMQAGEPILIYEISDNSMPPKYLWWLGLPLNFLFAIVVSCMVRPFTFSRFLLTFLLPVIPCCFAWDGGVSNARTYTVSDLDELLKFVGTNDNYAWTYEVLPGKPGGSIYLMGCPKAE